jgi:hypothetical protein
MCKTGENMRGSLKKFAVFAIFFCFCKAESGDFCKQFCENKMFGGFSNFKFSNLIFYLE